MCVDVFYDIVCILDGQRSEEVVLLFFNRDV